MKKMMLSGMLLLALIGGAYAQSSEKEISKEFYKDDSHLSIILNYLPKGWTFKAVADSFKIISPDTVRVLEERFNARPSENKEERIKRIQAGGKRVIPEIIIRYENLWPAEKVQQARSKNSTIDNEIARLPDKYHITKLLDNKLSTKENKVYTGSSDSEKRQVDQYLKEKAQLEAKKIAVPDFHSQKYSLFIYSLKGNYDENHLVYPDKPSSEIYFILSTFREICGK